ncbi:MAG: hypothetical protein KIT14_11335 [bacterium]|nr:hypothetical protein [bacterium]
MAGFDEALQALYRASLADFVAQRKEGVAALRGAGDAAGAAELAARRRPTLSAWAVNQLYWQARPAFHALLSAAERMRGGDLAAAAAHRQAMATLRKRAAGLLGESGHAANEATLRRVTTTLAALAARGGFAPDLPGTLAEDRDPPGFEAMVGAVAPARPARSRPANFVAQRKEGVAALRCATRPAGAGGTATSADAVGVGGEPALLAGAAGVPRAAVGRRAHARRPRGGGGASSGDGDAAQTRRGPARRGGHAANRRRCAV